MSADCTASPDVCCLIILYQYFVDFDQAANKLHRVNSFACFVRCVTCFVLMLVSGAGWRVGAREVELRQTDQ